MSEVPDWNDFNRKIIEEFRSNGGKVGPPFAGADLLILTSTGAKTQLPRTSPLVYLKDGERLVIIASKAGMPTHPDWYHNLVARPEATVEVGTETYQVQATIETGTERKRLFDAMAARMPVFTEYEQKAPREIPVFTLTRK